MNKEKSSIIPEKGIITVVKDFKEFLKIIDPNKIPTRKKKKLQFLYWDIITNKALFSIDYQFCTTNIAKTYKVSSQTASNWIKDLMKLGIIRRISEFYIIGKTSKTYRINLESNYIKKINELNFFNDAGFTPKVIITTRGIPKRVRRLDLITDDLLELAKKYAIPGFEAFMVDVIKHYPECFLYSPSFHNIRVVRLYDFYRAFKTAASQHNYILKQKFKDKDDLEWQTIEVPQFKRSRFYKDGYYIKSREDVSTQHLNELIVLKSKANDSKGVAQLRLLKDFSYSEPYINYKKLGIDNLEELAKNPDKYPGAFI